MDEGVGVVAGLRMRSEQAVEHAADQRDAERGADLERVEIIMPDANPAWRGSMLPITALITDGITVPKPSPPQIRPNSRLCGLTPPTASITMPKPITCSAKPSVSVARAKPLHHRTTTAAKLTKKPMAKGSVARPAASGDWCRPLCR